MASTIKSTRLRQGVSVNELASRLKVTPSAISQLERSEAEGSIKLSSVKGALAELGVDLRITVEPVGDSSRYAPYRVAEAMTDSLLVKNDPTFALRLLTHSAQEIRDNPDSLSRAQLEIAPTPLPHPGWDTLMRAIYARSMPSSFTPAWTRTERLAEPWYVSQFPALRERAKRSTPDYLRRLNIFIDERSLSRA
ncbi:MAG: helix-turn-helix domain-containing protein [Microbacteriaceae bacterium]